MKEKNINSLVERKLEEFGSSGGLDVTAEWKRSLQLRLGRKEKNKFDSGFVPKLIITALIIVILNIGFLLRYSSKTAQQDSDRQNDLNIILKELLVNPDN